MSQNVSLKPIQDRFISLLLQGSTIVDAAKACNVSEKTAHRWLKDPVIHAEKERRQSAVLETEQQMIERIMSSGYALVHNRVAALDKMARGMEEPYVSKKGDEYPLHTNPERLREWRGLLDDIAKELGQRIKKQEIEHSGLVEMLNAEHASLVGDLEGLPSVNPDQKQESNTDPGTDSVPPGA